MAWTQTASIKGDKGDKGDTGTTGAAGNTPNWLNGTGAPGSGLGAVGDMYLNNSNQDVYGPKTGSGWGSVVCNIKGATGSTGSTGATGSAGSNGTNGTNGARGATWWTGSGAPGTVSGSVAGDLYLDTATGNVYTLS